MNLHLFFEGTMAREPISSAFLATLLDQCNEVRNYFFDRLADCVGQELAEFKKRQWTICVERYAVDIRLDSLDGEWVILLENKLQRGSVQRGQLARYYLEQINREPARRVVAVLLAPGPKLGESEVEGVKSLDEFHERNRDFATRLSWATVSKLLESLSTTDVDAQFISSGMSSINKVMEDLEKRRFPNVGGREYINDTAFAVHERLAQKCPQIRIGRPFPLENSFTLSSWETNITLWLVLLFKAHTEPPYAPIDLFDGKKMRLTLQAKLKLSEKGSRNHQLKQRWTELIASGAADACGRWYELEGKWLVLQQEFNERQQDLIIRLSEIGESALRFVDTFTNETTKGTVAVASTATRLNKDQKRSSNEHHL